MTDHPMLAAVVFLLLIGFMLGGVGGWIARGEQNRGWYANVVRQLAATRAQLTEALADLDEAHAELDAAHTWRVERTTPPPAPEIHVHVAAALPWVAHQALPVDSTRVADAQLVLPAGEVRP